MGNCNCTSKSAANAVEKNDPNSVFQYDKDKKKIIYIGEDTVNGHGDEIPQAATLSQSVSQSMSQSDSGSVANSETNISPLNQNGATGPNSNGNGNGTGPNVSENLSNVRSLLGEIAEYLDEDDSTFATGSAGNGSLRSGSQRSTNGSQRSLTGSMGMVTPTNSAGKPHNNSVVSFQNSRQTVSPLLFDTDDIQLQAPYSDSKSKKLDDIVMRSKEQEMVKNAKLIFTATPDAHQLYENPNGFEGVSSPKREERPYAQQSSLTSPRSTSHHYDDNNYHNQNQYDDEESNETSLAGIEHVPSQDNSEFSYPYADENNNKHEFDNLLGELEEMPTDEEEGSVIIAGISPRLETHDINDTRDIKDSHNDNNNIPKQSNDVSISFGSFMHASYEEPVTTNENTHVVEKDLIIFSPDAPPKKDQIEEAMNPEGTQDDKVTLMKKSQIEPISMDQLYTDENDTSISICSDDILTPSAHQEDGSTEILSQAKELLSSYKNDDRTTMVEVDDRDDNDDLVSFSETSNIDPSELLADIQCSSSEDISIAPHDEEKHDIISNSSFIAQDHEDVISNSGHSNTISHGEEEVEQMNTTYATDDENHNVSVTTFDERSNQSASTIVQDIHNSSLGDLSNVSYGDELEGTTNNAAVDDEEEAISTGEQINDYVVDNEDAISAGEQSNGDASNYTEDTEESSNAPHDEKEEDTTQDSESEQNISNPDVEFMNIICDEVSLRNKEESENCQDGNVDEKDVITEEVLETENETCDALIVAKDQVENDISVEKPKNDVRINTSENEIIEKENFDVEEKNVMESMAQKESVLDEVKKEHDPKTDTDLILERDIGVGNSRTILKEEMKSKELEIDEKTHSESDTAETGILSEEVNEIDEKTSSGNDSVETGVKTGISINSMENKFLELQCIQSSSNSDDEQSKSPASSQGSRTSDKSLTSRNSKSPEKNASQLEARALRSPPRKQIGTMSHMVKKSPGRFYHNQSSPRTRHVSDDASVESSVSLRSMRSNASTLSNRTPNRKFRVYGNTPTKLLSPTPTKSSLLRMANHNSMKNDDSSVFSNRSPMSVTPNSLPWDEKERKLRSQQSPSGSIISTTSESGRKAAHRRVVAVRSSAGKKACKRNWNPTAFPKRRGCVRCLGLASTKERKQYYKEGRHPRIAMTRGGCYKGCDVSNAFLLANPDVKHDDEEFARLCRICFNALHR